MSNEIDYLLFKDKMDNIIYEEKQDSILLTDFDNEEFNHHYTLFSALMPNEKNNIRQILSNCHWGDLNIEYFGKPTFYRNEFDNIIYDPMGCLSDKQLDLQPIVYYRYFDGICEPYIDIDQNFILYRNLFYNNKLNNYSLYDDSGKTESVINLEVLNSFTRVKTSLRYLKDYLAAKKFVLIRYFDIWRASLNNNPKKKIIYKDKNYYFCAETYEHSEDNFKTLSRFMGKQVIYPYPEPLHPDYIYLKVPDIKENDIEFIIGIDENGNEKYFSCSEKKLKNNFGANPENPDYLTPVFFKNEVLKKYYDSSKYTVHDSILSCGCLWSITFGKVDDTVHAWLGDLDKLPENEKHHWKQFNIASGKLSKVKIMRDICAIPTDSDDTLIIFKENYNGFQKKWFKKFNWDLFIPLHNDDKHYFESLHIPCSEENLEFEQQIGGLAKILCDSLNVSELQKETAKSDEKGPINIFETYLKLNYSISNSSELVKVFRIIQEIRSSFVAHRKGTNYKKVLDKYKINEVPFRNFFEQILKKIIEIFDQLEKLCLNE